MNGSDPFSAALRLLTGRDRSEHDLARRLRLRGFDDAAVAAALDRCREFGYLDDRRFARNRARELMRSGRAVGGKALADLKAQGLDEELARSALTASEEEFAAAEVLAGLLERRFPDFAWTEAPERERRRVVDFFRRRGFPLAVILESLNKRGR